MDDCIAKYMWVKQMSSRMAELKRAGKPLPKTVGEVEQMLGNCFQDIAQMPLTFAFPLDMDAR